MTYTITTLGPKVSTRPAMSPVSPLSQDSSLSHVLMSCFRHWPLVPIPFSAPLLSCCICLVFVFAFLPPSSLCLCHSDLLYFSYREKWPLCCGRLPFLVLSSYLLLQWKTKLCLPPLSCLISVLSLLPLHPHCINFCMLPILNSVNQINLSLTL